MEDVTLTYGIIVGITNDVFPKLSFEVKDGSRVRRKLHQKLILAKHINEKAFEPHGEVYEKSRKEIMDQYIETDDKGNYKTEDIPVGPGGTGRPFIFASTDKKEEFQKKIVELLNTEVTVSVQKVSLDLFPEYIEEDVVRACAFMIEEYDQIRDKPERE